MQMTMNSVQRPFLVINTFFCFMSANVAYTVGQDANSPKGIPSIIQVIGANREELGKTLAEKLGERFKSSRSELRKYLSMAEQDLKAIRDDPKNETLRTRYEDHLSRGLLAADDMLSEMISAKPEILDELNNVRGSVEKAKEVLERAAKADAAEREESSKKVEDIEAALRRYATNYSHQIAENQELPSEVRESIRVLENELNAEKAIINFSSYANSQNVLEGLKVHTQQLNDMEEDMRIAFNRAANQKRLVGKIAKFRRRGIYAGMLAAETAMLNQTVRKYQAQLQGLDDLRLVEASRGSLPKVTAANRRARREKTNEFLKNYIDNSSVAVSK